MNNIINLAWKNIWRNKVRSGIILGAIAIGLSTGTFMLAFMKGWIIDTVNSDIQTQLSHIQIHDTAFLVNYDINAYFIRDKVEENIHKDLLTQYAPATTYRLNLTGMLASAYNAIGVNAKGVWAEEEMQVTTIWKQIPDTLGAFLPDDARMPIVISQKMMNKLKVKLHSKIVFSFQDTHGDMQSIAFRVCGVYKTTNAAFDEGTVFVRYNDIFDYTALPKNAVHEAAILVSDLKTSDIITPQIKSLLPEMAVQDWKELNPAISMTLAYTDFFCIIIMIIFLLALSFGIINTMLMAVLERTRELGMLGAIGMSKRKIFNMIMLETIFLTLLGGIIGIIVGILIVFPLQKTGIDLSFYIKDYYEDFGFGAVVYPVLDIKTHIQIIFLVILTGILSALYPARKALKMKPLDAIKI